MNRPVLYMLIGLPASGKSTFLKTLQDVEIISGDTLRGELFGDEKLQYTEASLKENGYDPETMNEQERSFYGRKLIWDMCLEKALDFLQQGISVAYDGVNNVPKYRSEIITAASEISLIHAVVINTDIETCIERDKRRSRTVGEDVIRHIAGNMVPPDFSEGFDIIDTYNKNGELISHRTRE